MKIHGKNGSDCLGFVSIIIYIDVIYIGGHPVQENKVMTNFLTVRKDNGCLFESMWEVIVEVSVKNLIT